MNRQFVVAVALAVVCAMLNPASAAPIHDAVKGGNLGKTRQLLDGGADVNARDEQSYTPLHLAVDMGFLEITQLLLEHNADTTSTDKTGETPLHIAAVKGRRKAVVLLLDHGAEINAHDYQGRTPLVLSIQEGRAPIVEFLLDKNAYAEGDEEGSEDALSVAIRSGKTDIINLLIKRGMHVTVMHLNPAICAHNLKLVQTLVKSDAGTVPHALAETAMCGDRKTLDFLMRNAGMIDYNGAARSIAAMASDAQPPNLDLVKVLFAADPNPRQTSTTMLADVVHRGCSADFLAYLLGKGADADKVVHDFMESNPMLPYAHLEMVKLFLKHGAKVDTVTDWGNTPLMLAIPDNNLEVVKYLLDHGASAKSANILGNTPLHFAAARNLTEISELLIKKGAKVNVANADGNTPLHQSVRFPAQFETAGLLLKNGANIKARNKEGMTALHYAAARGTWIDAGNQTVVEDQVVNSWQRPYEAPVDDARLLTLIIDLVKGGANVRDKDGQGRYVFDLARANTQHPAVAPFIEAQIKKTRQ